MTTNFRYAKIKYNLIKRNKAHGHEWQKVKVLKMKVKNNAQNEVIVNTVEVKEVIVNNEAVANATESEGTNMEIKEETQEVIAEAQDSTVEERTHEADTVAQEVEAQAQTDESAPVDKKAEYIANLDKKLRTFPRKLTIADLIGYRMYGLETWLSAQRQPSHTANKALEIIDSALNGIPCGVVSLGVNTDDNTLCTINGSSRIDDFIKYYTGAVGKKDATYKDLPKEVAKKFLAFELSIDWHVGTEKELIRDFKNLNNDVALTGGQKAVTNLVGSGAMDIIAKLGSHSLFAKMFSARQLQKQEQNNCLFLILANITDCYNAKIDKVTESLASKDLSTLDVNKLIYIFDKIESADVELTKFKFIHLAHLMYIGDCWKSKSLHHAFDVDMVNDTAISVAVSVNYTTSGTNSSEVNTKRIESMAKKLYVHFSTAQAEAPQTAQAVETLDPDTL